MACGRSMRTSTSDVTRLWLLTRTAFSTLWKRNALEFVVELLSRLRKLQCLLLAQRNGHQRDRLRNGGAENGSEGRAGHRIRGRLCRHDCPRTRVSEQTRPELSAARKALPTGLEALALVLVHRRGSEWVPLGLRQHRCRPRLSPGDGPDPTERLLLRHAASHVGVGLGDDSPLGQLLRTAAGG